MIELLVQQGKGLRSDRSYFVSEQKERGSDSDKAILIRN